MHIQVQRDVDDIVAFSDHYLSRSRYVKRAVARYRLFGALAIGGVTLLVTFTMAPNVALFGTIMSLVAALCFASQAGGIVKRNRRKVIRRLYTAGKNSPALGKMELEVQETG